MDVQGVSTRKVRGITEELCGHAFSASSIGSINKKLDATLAEWPGRSLDAGERHDDAAEAIDQQVAAEQCGGSGRPVADTAQGERDQRIEDDGRQDGALRARQRHDVEGANTNLRRR